MNGDAPDDVEGARVEHGGMFEVASGREVVGERCGEGLEETTPLYVRKI